MLLAAEAPAPESADAFARILVACATLFLTAIGAATAAWLEERRKREEKAKSAESAAAECACKPELAAVRAQLAEVHLAILGNEATETPGLRARVRDIHRIVKEKLSDD